jgi:hypothetical protein
MIKTVVTLTTIPPRLSSPNKDNIQSCIASLLDQDYLGVYEVHLNIPSVFKYQNIPYIIPDWVKELAGRDKRFKYFDNLEDLGPITKVYYTVHRLTDPEDIIIVCDDDLVYHRSMISQQVTNQIKYDNTAVGYDGNQGEGNPFDDDLRNYKIVSTYKNVYVNTLQHYKTVSYKRKFFKEDFNLEFVTISYNDDIVMSAYMGKHGIKRMVTSYAHEPALIDNNEWKEKGGALTFPVIKHTAHGGVEEGCWLYRIDKVDENMKYFVNLGYLK